VYNFRSARCASCSTRLHDPLPSRPSQPPSSPPSPQPPKPGYLHAAVEPCDNYKNPSDLRFELEVQAPSRFRSFTIPPPATLPSRSPSPPPPLASFSRYGVLVRLQRHRCFPAENGELGIHGSVLVLARDVPLEPLDVVSIAVGEKCVGATVRQSRARGVLVESSMRE